MSRRSCRKRKEDEAFVVSEDDDDEERKDDKRSKIDEAAASSSSSAAAAATGASPARPQPAPSVAASSSPAAAAAAASSSSSAAAAAASSSVPPSRPLAEPEKLDCAQCKDAFECTDASGLLPRNLPCGHVLCSTCIKDNLSRTPGFVVCPEGEGPQQIGTPAAAAPTMDDWLRKLQPAKDLIAAIRNQQSLMTRIGQQGARCSRPGCDAAVTHYCSDCPGDLCSAHERTRHTVFPAHKAHTMPIALKASFLHDQTQSKLSGPAAEIRARAHAQLQRHQREAQRLIDARSELEAELQALLGEVDTNAKALADQQRTVDRMTANDDETVLEIEVERLDALPDDRPVIYSAVLNDLPDEPVTDLQAFLGPGRSLSKAKLIYRASRDGFATKDWWRQCLGKSNTLTLIKVQDNGFVFGAFAPFQWPIEASMKKETAIADPTGATFLFSLVNAHDRALKLRLKEDCKDRAARVSSSFGPKFGADLRLMSNGKSADSPVGNWTEPFSFEFDSVADDGEPINYDSSLLTGDDGNENGRAFFAAAEIESWQL